MESKIVNRWTRAEVAHSLLAGLHDLHVLQLIRGLFSSIIENRRQDHEKQPTDHGFLPAPGI